MGAASDAWISGAPTAWHLEPSAGVISAALSSPGVSGFVQRLQARGSRSFERFGWAILQAAELWLWVLLSAATFVLVTATASVADPRMLAIRRIARLPGDLLRGMRLFLRMAADRRTPWVARIIILLGLAYWLAPGDLILDDPYLPGFIDDIVIAVLVGRAFTYFCPSSVLARHAHAVSV